MAKRFDHGSIENFRRLDDGRLWVNATFSRVGDLSYLNSDGAIRVETLTAEELFNADSLETAGLAPVTLGHPESGFVTPDNYKDFAVGASGSKVIARADEGLVDVVFVVGDRTAIEAIENNDSRQVSAGYTTEIVQRGDKFYQTKRRYNHLALVPQGRAGDSVKVHFDSDDLAIQVIEEKRSDMKYKGMDMSEVVMDAFKKMEEDMAKMKEDMRGMKIKADAVEGDLTTRLTAENDMLKAKVDQLNSQLSDSLTADEVAAKADAIANEKLTAFENVRQFLPAETKFDASLTAIDWKKAAIVSQRPSLNLDEKSDAYVVAAFDMLSESGVTQTPEEKSDEQRSDAYKRVLKQAQISGHDGPSLSNYAAETKQDAEDIAAVDQLFAGDVK